MSLNPDNEITKKSWEINFEEFNKTICNDEHLKLSHRNLIEIYRFLYKFFIEEKYTDFNNYLTNTTYFNKIIFLKYLNFFRNLNELEKRVLNEIEEYILELGNEISKLEEINEELEQDEKKYENNPDLFGQNAEIIEEKKLILDKVNKRFKNEEKKYYLIKQKFIGNAENIFGGIEINEDDPIMTLFDVDTIDKIYNAVITHINNNTDSFNAYMTLFHLNNEPINVSSNKAIFYIGVHGTLCIVVPNNTYLTIKTPVNTTINRWGERGEVIKYFNTMDYTFKQCLLTLTYGEDLTNNNAEKCFNLLGTSKGDFNMGTRQTTPAYYNTEADDNTEPDDNTESDDLSGITDLKKNTNNLVESNKEKFNLKTITDDCVPEPDSYFSKSTIFNENKKIRIKHYSIDSYDFMIFNFDYTIPNDLFTNLSSKIPSLNTRTKTIQYNTAENIISLNYLLFTNNINFTIFNLLNIEDETRVKTFGLYPDIGLYPRYYLEEGNTFLQSHLHNFNFPLDIFSFKTNLLREDFTLDRDIYALNNIYIHLTYQNVDRSFVLFKGDSFLCNPYIIEYFIKKFNSKITIRPGPILGDKEDNIFKENSQMPTTSEKGSTITCLSKGLSCYKVTLSVLTNYEILQFCKDAKIKTCDLYDTTCQSFDYLNPVGKVIPDYNPSYQEKLVFKRMNTKDDPTMLSKYDNLSDIYFDKIKYFKVVGDKKRNFDYDLNTFDKVIPDNNPSDQERTSKRMNTMGDPTMLSDKRKETFGGGRTQKSINIKKNSRKQNNRKQKKSKTKKVRRQKVRRKRYTNITQKLME